MIIFRASFFYKKALCSFVITFIIMFKYVKTGKYNEHMRQKSRDEVSALLFFFIFSSWDKISSWQKRVNSKRDFTIDSDDLIAGRVSSLDEISRVYTLWEIFAFLSRLFGYIEKRLNNETMVNFKVYDVTDWTTNNFNTHIA